MGWQALQALGERVDKCTHAYLTWSTLSGTVVYTHVTQYFRHKCGPCTLPPCALQQPTLDGRKMAPYDYTQFIFSSTPAHLNTYLLLDERMFTIILTLCYPLIEPQLGRTLPVSGGVSWLLTPPPETCSLLACISDMIYCPLLLPTPAAN